MKNKGIVLILFLILFTVGCQSEKNEGLLTPSEQPSEDTEEVVEYQEEQGTSVEETDSSINEDNETEDIVDIDADIKTPAEQLLASMTLEEKIGQLFIVDIYSLNGDQNAVAMTDTMESQIQTYHIGGVLFFDPNIESPEQTNAFIKALQMASDIPLFISVDEEGGIVRRIGNNPAMGLSQVPTANEIGALNDKTYTYDLAYTMGQEMLALGFNMDFAPVADVNTNPDNPIIGNRAFSGDPLIVADMVSAFSKGLQDAGVIAVAKHFPGHGDTSLDTHTGDVYVEHDMNRLETIELIPFKAAIDNEIAGIMSAHIILPNVTGHDLPATFSKELLRSLLRDQYGYEGLTITDAMTMDAVSKRFSTKEAGVYALEAGNDIILMPDDLEETYLGLLEAIQEEDALETLLDEAVLRILETKMTYHIIE